MEFRGCTGRATPPWYLEEEITHDMARDFSTGLQALIIRLESNVSDIKLESELHSKVS
jgi:hypothetical protein